MNRSEQINELATALSKAQGEIKGALKDSDNPFFKSRYADLASIWDACRTQLANNGLCIVQMPETSDTGGIAVETILMHSSGQWVSSRFVIPVAKLDAQGIGSAITYARRYALSAMVGVAPEDDDGNAAADKKKIPTPDPVPIAQDFSAEIRALKDCGTISSLSLAWNKLDKRVQYALTATKDECKNAILKAEKNAADVPQ